MVLTLPSTRLSGVSCVLRYWPYLTNESAGDGHGAVQWEVFVHQTHL